MSNSNSFKKIPQELEGKVIVITGTYPGVGKSYTKNDWAIKLRRGNYRVYNDGTTQKASEDQTIYARNRISEHGKIRSIEEIPYHKLANGFYFIDEAWMYTQEQIAELVSKYPRMCFILFGDPLQLSSPELSKENRSLLREYHFGWNLTVQRRASDERLYEAIKDIKNGKVPFSFIVSRMFPINRLPQDALQIVLRNETRDQNNKTTNIDAGQIYRARTTSINNNGIVKNNRHTWWKNGELYRIIRIDELKHIYLVRLDGWKPSSPIDEETLKEFFDYSPFINVHKAQGDTINSDTSIIIDIDDFTYTDFLRQLYVAISRAKSSEQIFFPEDSAKHFIDQIIQNNIQFLPLKSPLKNDRLFDTDSDTMTSLSHADKIIDLLVYMSKKFPVTLRYYNNAKSSLKSSPAVTSHAAFELKHERSSEADADTDLKEVKAQSDIELYSLEGPEYKSRRHAIQKYLQSNNGEGYSDKWNESERAYADSIRQKYTLFNKFIGKVEENEKRARAEDDRIKSIAAGIKPEKSEEERKRENNLRQKHKRFRDKMLKDHPELTIEEIEEMWTKRA